MDQALLEALQAALCVLSQAQQGVERDTALMRVVQTDLVGISRRNRHQQGSSIIQDGITARVRGPAGLPVAANESSRPRQQLQAGKKSHLLQSIQPQQQEAMPDQADVTAGASCMELPADLLRLQQQYTSLQDQQAFSAGSQPGTAEAAVFIQQLEAAYGPGLKQQQDHQQQQRQQQAVVGSAQLPAVQQAHARQLDVAAYADQAGFIGLVAAMLRTVQSLSTLAPTSSSQHGGQQQSQLSQVVNSLLLAGEQWLQQHTTAHQQQPGPEQAAAPQHDEAARWRNRALRSITASAAAAIGGGRSAASSPAADVHLPGLWLPQQCWQPLLGSTATPSARSTASPSSYRAMWEALLPGPPLQPHPSSLGLGPRGPHLPAASSRGCYVDPPATISYSDVSEMVQHSRHLHKVQQLLLQYAVESQAAPRLLDLLLWCCQQLQPGATAQPVSGLGVTGSGVTHDRCCALYRLVYALTSGPPKQRGLGPGCQLAVETQASDEQQGW